MAFFDLPWLDYSRVVIQIGILFFRIYGVLYYLRNTKGVLILTGIVILSFSLALLLRIPILELNALSFITDEFGHAMLIALLVIFQPELRRALAQLGSYIAREGKQRREVVSEIVAAAESMAQRKCGALIVIERKIQLQTLIDDSIPLDIKINALVLESIFFPNSPLHDGAVIIRGNRIVAARAILPLTRAEHVSRHLGTRHRAALGIAEETDAVTIVISEETGVISLAWRKTFNRDLSKDELENLLEQIIVHKDNNEFDESVKMLDEELQEDSGNIQETTEK